MSSAVTVQANPTALIESIARTMPPQSQEDFRNFANLLVNNLTYLSPGGNLLQAGGTQANSAAAPTGVTFTATGASGVITVSITDPNTAKAGTIWHEISYCTLASFTQNVTTLPATTATSASINNSGFTGFLRMRVSYDRVNWSGYQALSSGQISAGQIEATAMAPAAAFNQSNYGVVNSAASGGAAAVSISGTGGQFTSYPAVRGTQQQNRPSATIVGVEPQSQQFVGWDGTTFRLKPTLAGVLADDLEPVGAVSVVGTAAPTLPTIVPIIAGGGIVGYDVTNGGAGASQPYTLTIADVGGGAGATAGQQTIQNGVLISIAPGNAGHGYTGATMVTASGGTGGGKQGGGTAAGGNGARMSNV
jgi:hypothetical protein